jgi:hypothetical protein
LPEAFFNQVKNEQISSEKKKEIFISNIRKTAEIWLSLLFNVPFNWG